MTGLENNPLYKNVTVMWERALVGRKMAFDIGANNGGYSRSMAEHGLEVHAYEPVPDMFKVLDEVSLEFPFIHPHRLAVSDIIQSVTGLNVFSAWTLLPDSTPWSKALEYAEKPPFDCDFTTIDFESNLYGLPDFIKLDVDGYELRVIRGAVKTMEKARCPILFEYSYLLEKLGDSATDMVSLIYSLGYEAWCLDGNYVCRTREQMLDCYPAQTSFDCMLVHKDNPVQ